MELVKINASEYGLEENKAKEIEAQFKPMLDKMIELETEYNEILTLEIDAETCSKAKELRLRYVKVRTGTDTIHKAQKAFYLSGGRFCDGWKNAQLFASQGCESTLMAIEKHYETLETERISDLQTERAKKISKYLDSEHIDNDLGNMNDMVWDAYFQGTKLNYDNRIEAEKQSELERLETERINKLHNDRKESILHLWSYVDHNLSEKNFGEYSDTAWQSILNQLNSADKAEKERQEKIRLENERLEKEAEKKQKEHEAQLKKERQEREKEVKESAILQAQLNAENQEKERKLQALKDAEQKEKQRLLDIEQKRIKAEKAATLAPDKDKLIDLSKRIMSIEMPVLKSKETNDIMLNVIDLLSKIDSYITEKVNDLR